MPLVTLFKNFSEPVANKPIEAILKAIGSGAWQKQIKQLRYQLNIGNKTEFERLKKLLLAFTPSGHFECGRKMEYLKQYSGFVILDIDKLGAKKLQQLKEKIQKSKYTYTCFISPSGHGLKILICVSTGPENHKETFLQLQKHFEKLLNVSIDKSGKDITRLCFISYDPDIYINFDSEIFSFVQTQLAESHNASQNKNIQENLESIYQDTISFTERKEIYSEGNRNNFIYLLANNLNRKGVSLNDALTLILRDYNYNESEAIATIKSAYNNSPEALSPYPSGEGRYEVTTHHSPSKSSIVQHPKPNSQSSKSNRRRSITTNKFILAQEFIKKHFVIRRNIVTQEYECREMNKSEFESMNENNIFIKMQTSGLNISLNNLIALLKSDFIPIYNPFIEYFENLPPWDGKTDHIVYLASFIKTKDRQRFDKHFKKWLVRVVACALIDSYFNKQAFVLVHDKQNSGKSTFCRFLCPPGLQNYIAENISIDKDSRILLTRNLLINLDELSTLSKVEINSLKSLFSKDKINERLPYDRRNSIIPRRCSFIGSTNQIEFLNDETGSVRWLCFVIDEIDWSYKDKANIDLVYCQAYHLFKVNFEYNLSTEEIKENEEHNKQFQINTTEKELVIKYLIPGTKEKHQNFWTATDVLLYLTNITESKVKLSSNNIGKALKLCGFERTKHSSEKIYGYYVICK